MTKVLTRILAKWKPRRLLKETLEKHQNLGAFILTALMMFLSSLFFSGQFLALLIALELLLGSILSFIIIDFLIELLS